MSHPFTFMVSGGAYFCVQDESSEGLYPEDWLRVAARKPAFGKCTSSRRWRYPLAAKDPIPLISCEGKIGSEEYKTVS